MSRRNLNENQFGLPGRRDDAASDGMLAETGLSTEQAERLVATATMAFDEGETDDVAQTLWSHYHSSHPELAGNASSTALVDWAHMTERVPRKEVQA